MGKYLAIPIFGLKGAKTELSDALQAAYKFHGFAKQN